MPIREGINLAERKDEKKDLEKNEDEEIVMGREIGENSAQMSDKRNRKKKKSIIYRSWLVGEPYIIQFSFVDTLYSFNNNVFSWSFLFHKNRWHERKVPENWIGRKTIKKEKVSGKESLWKTVKKESIRNVWRIMVYQRKFCISRKNRVKTFNTKMVRIQRDFPRTETFIGYEEHQVNSIRKSGVGFTVS